MADKKEVNILLLGIVAILAIVGLVLLFSSPAATGKAFFPPPYQEVAYPAPLSGQGIPPGPAQQGMIGNAIYIPYLEATQLPLCPNGRLRTREQGNVVYAAAPTQKCAWFTCPGLEGSSDPAAQPRIACALA